MAKSCVCYVIDDNYLFPTLVSAEQAKRFTPAADVIIICLTKSNERVDLVRDVADEIGVTLLSFGPDAIENMHPMFGRLFIPSMLSDVYNRIVYIDGDTQIAGSLQPLIDVEIPKGKFLAVRDPAAMFAKLSPKWHARVKADRDQAGLNGNLDDYLNTGVLVFNREDWIELAAKTLAVLKDRDTPFKFGDQDPMNLAIGDRCLYISNRWNFPGFLINTQAVARVKPVIYHFMSNPRPWLHSGQPWGAVWTLPYKEFIQRFPVVRPTVQAIGTVTALKYSIQQILKCSLEYRPVARIKEAPAILAL